MPIPYQPPELPDPYPRLNYVAEVTERAKLPLPGVGLVRGVCLAAYIAQDNPNAASFFSEVSAAEVQYWTPAERIDYPVVRGKVEAFFETGGVGRLASAACSEVVISNRLAATDMQAAQITRIWGICRDFLPSHDQLLQTEPIYKALGRVEHDALFSRGMFSGLFREVIQSCRDLDPLRPFRQLRAEARIDRRLKATLHHLLASDIESVTNGRPAGSFDAEPHESLVREMILRSRSTGSGAFNLIMHGLQTRSREPSVQLQLHSLQKAWENHHSDQPFWPTGQIES